MQTTIHLIVFLYYTSFLTTIFMGWSIVLLDSDRLGQVPWEVNIQPLGHSKPIGHELQGNYVEQTLKSIESAGDLDPVGLVSRELGVIGVTDDYGPAVTGNNLVVGVKRLGEVVITGQDHDKRQCLH